MQLHEIWAKISESWDEWWNYIPEGPLYNYNLGTSNGGASVFGWHDARAILNEDVDIAIEWGMSEDPFENRRDYKPEWAPFPDPTAHLCYADIFYRGALVDRVLMASVDGGRAYLPAPEHKDGKLIVMDRPYQLVRLINDITGTRDFESYFERSGIYKWPA
ncbi:hypothetical protein QFZ53_003709 [Microbacterium natoriense]|uniref:Uncharacterized protein n=1 Tax=Microbacterium natoriense TaxID=284570 RepID=A0AAW8F157_9MICO|nr:hypothetical protein [Microbacterium natoriense]MDQ0649513.1 hypothetical protein [Microbacterium natoriense]